jgi:hypothetical protein
VTEDVDAWIERLRSIALQVAGYKIGPGTEAAPEVNAAFEKEYDQLVKQILKQPGEVELLPPFIRDIGGLGGLFADLQARQASRTPRRDYVNREFDEWRARRTSRAPRGPPAPPAFDWEIVQKSWQRAIDDLDTDNESAMTNALATLESVLKHSIEKCGDTWLETDKIPELWSKIRTSLRRKLPVNPRNDAFLRALDGLSNAVAALGTLRNKAGSAHGRGATHDAASKAEASLVVYAAGAIGRAIRDATED